MAMRFINVLSLSDSLDSTRRLQQPRFLSRHLSQFIQTSITPETLSVGRKKTEPWNGIEYIRREQNTKQCWSVSSVYFGHIATYKAKEKQRMHGTLINCTHSPPSNFQFSSFVAFVFQCAPSIHISLSLSIFLSHLNSHGKLILGSIYFIFFPSLQLCSVRPFLKFNIRAGSGIRCVCVYQFVIYTISIVIPPDTMQRNNEPEMRQHTHYTANGWELSHQQKRK